MKLLTYAPEIVNTKQFPGLVNCKFKHKIESATAEMDYLGPKIEPAIWKQVLAFFQWTYDTTHSESQVRLFVNLKDKCWAAWAFPQKARTGMTADELDTEDTKKQRAQFSDAEGWVYFGTVHHHCSASAFQSGTDRNNEEKIDGLHITIGNLLSQRYDMHARFYLNGFCFEPDMSKFWDIGGPLAMLLPGDLWDKVARFQMCEKAKTDAAFPEQWRVNLIEVKPSFQYDSQTTAGYSKSYGNWERGKVAGTAGTGIPYTLPDWLRARKAVGELALAILDKPYDRKAQRELAEWIRKIATENDPTGDLIEVIQKWDTTVMQMWTEIPASNELDPCIHSYRVEEKTVGEVDQKAADRHLIDYQGGGMGMMD